jgi:hypothetical protein
MTISEKIQFEKILQDNLKEDLDWLEREFELLFKEKRSYTKEEITLGNQIIDNIIDNIKTNDSEELLNLLAIVLNRMEKSYPAFF